MTQAASFTCDDCGQTQPVEPVTAYEFRVRCQCDRWLAWAHRNPPPTFTGKLEQGQLFDLCAAS